MINFSTDDIRTRIILSGIPSIVQMKCTRLLGIGRLLLTLLSASCEVGSRLSRPLLLYCGILNYLWVFLSILWHLSVWRWRFHSSSTLSSVRFVIWVKNSPNQPRFLLGVHVKVCQQWRLAEIFFKITFQRSVDTRLSYVTKPSRDLLTILHSPPPTGRSAIGGGQGRGHFCYLGEKK